MHVRTRKDPLDALVSLAYAAALDGALWPVVLTAASDHLGAIGGMVVRNEPRSGRGWMVVGRLRDDLTRLYLDRYVDNPYSRAIVGRPAGRAVRANSLVDLPAVRRSAFHADMLAPQGIAEMVVVPYAPWQRGSMTGGISFAFDARAADGAEAELRRRHARLVPHLLRAMDLAAACGAGPALARSLHALLDAYPNAAMLLDASGWLVHANPAAEELLREGDGLRAKCNGGAAMHARPRVYAARPADDRRLGEVIATAAASATGLPLPASGWGQAMAARIGRPSGRPDLVVSAVPLPAGAAPWVEPGAAHVALFVLRPGHGTQDGPRAAASVLAALFGLTPAEGRVAALVGAGLGLPGTARRLGVSAETARTHLRRCFAKTGARSQADLAGLLASLPAAGPAVGAPMVPGQRAAPEARAGIPRSGDAGHPVLPRNSTT